MQFDVLGRLRVVDADGNPLTMANKRCVAGTKRHDLALRGVEVSGLEPPTSTLRKKNHGARRHVVPRSARSSPGPRSPCHPGDVEDGEVDQAVDNVLVPPASLRYTSSGTTIAVTYDDDFDGGVECMPATRRRMAVRVLASRTASETAGWPMPSAAASCSCETPSLRRSSSSANRAMSASAASHAPPRTACRARGPRGLAWSAR